MAATFHSSPWATPASESIPALRDAVRGEVLTPGDAGYDAARLLRIGGIDRRPAAIVRAADAADVARVVTLARERGLRLAVRGGGHSLAGHGLVEGGVVLDLAALKALEIDVAGRAAWAGGGLTAGEYTAAAAGHGLATPFGDTATVGIGGITLAGGIGYLVRRHGLTIDSLLAAEVVTADGELRRVDAGTCPDLYWAIRGGGGNVGVVTRFRYRLHEVDTVLGGMLILPASPETVAAFVAAADVAPEELSTIATVMKAPPMPFIPAEAHGRLILMASVVYAGDIEAGERELAPIRALGTPILDAIGPKRYPEVFPPEDESYRPVATMRTMFVDRVDVPVAGMILDRLQESTAPMSAVQLRVLGGAMARVPAEATAFAHRGSRIMVNVAAMYGRPEEAEVHAPWVLEMMDALRQGDGGAYAGFMADEGEDRVRAAYPGATWERLAAIKGRYDPTNLFRHNQNVPPATVEDDLSAD